MTAPDQQDDSDDDVDGDWRHRAGVHVLVACDDEAGDDREVEEAVKDGVEDVAPRYAAGEIEEVPSERHGDGLPNRADSLPAEHVRQVDCAEDDRCPEGDLALGESVHAEGRDADATEHALLREADALRPQQQQEDEADVLVEQIRIVDADQNGDCESDGNDPHPALYGSVVDEHGPPPTENGDQAIDEEQRESYGEQQPVERLFAGCVLPVFCLVEGRCRDPSAALDDGEVDDDKPEKDGDRKSARAERRVRRCGRGPHGGRCYSRDSERPGRVTERVAAPSPSRGAREMLKRARPSCSRSRRACRRGDPG